MGQAAMLEETLDMLRKDDPEGKRRLEIAKNIGRLIQQIGKLWGIDGQLPVTVLDAVRSGNKTLGALLAFEIRSMTDRKETLDQHLKFMSSMFEFKARLEQTLGRTLQADTEDAAYLYHWTGHSDRYAYLERLAYYKKAMAPMF